MRRSILVGLVAAGILASGPVRAQQSPKSQLQTPVSLRVRYEVWDWFDPGDLPATINDNNSYGYGAGLLKFGLRYDSGRWWDLYLEGQNTALLGLPDDARAPAPQGEMGAGASHFGPHMRVNDDRVFMNQGYLTLKAPAHGATYLRAGRFEYLDGAEVLTGDPSLDWLKRARLAGRLIANFGFSQVQRTFDGFSGAYDRPGWNLTLMATHPRQGGFELDGWKDISKVDIAAATLTLKPGTVTRRSEGRFFLMYYEDHRGPADSVVMVDNRAAAVRALDSAAIRIPLVGGHFIQTAPLGKGQVDLLGWGVYQRGTWGALDHRAWAFAVEGGYQFSRAPWKPWFRAGYNRSSGDSDPADGAHQTYFQLLTTVRPFALFPFYNMMNTGDLFAQVILRPVPGRLVVRSDLHSLHLSNAQDLWYGGSGAYQRRGSFGFGGRPSNGHDALATLADLSLDWTISPHWNANAYYGHAFGGDVVGAIYQQRSANLAYLELNVKY